MNVLVNEVRRKIREKIIRNFLIKKVEEAEVSKLKS
jgi:hypothetical protein